MAKVGQISRVDVYFYQFLAIFFSFLGFPFGFYLGMTILPTNSITSQETDLNGCDKLGPFRVQV